MKQAVSLAFLFADDRGLKRGELAKTNSAAFRIIQPGERPSNMTSSVGAGNGLAVGELREGARSCFHLKPGNGS